MEGDAVLDVHHTCEGASGLDEKLRRGVRVGDELHELDTHEGDLRHQVVEVEGLEEDILLLLGEALCVEPMFTGIAVARLAAGPTVRGVVLCIYRRRRLEMAVLGVKGSHMLMINGAPRYGVGGDGEACTKFPVPTTNHDD